MAGRANDVIDISFVNDEATFLRWKHADELNISLRKLAEETDLDKLYAGAYQCICEHCFNNKKPPDIGLARCNYARVFLSVLRAFLKMARAYNGFYHELESFPSLDKKRFELTSPHLSYCWDDLRSEIESQFIKSWNEGCWAAGFWMSQFYYTLADNLGALSEEWTWYAEVHYIKLGSEWMQRAYEKKDARAILLHDEGEVGEEILRELALVVHYPVAVYKYAEILRDQERNNDAEILENWSLQFDEVKQVKAEEGQRRVDECPF